MYVLNNDDMSSKVDSLVEINNIITHDLEEYRDELGAKADKLIECLANLAKYTFDKPV